MQLDISNRTIFRILAMIVLFAGFFWVIFLVHRPLSWLAMAAFLALALNPAVDFLAKFMPRKSRGLAAVVVFLVTLSVVGYMVSTLVPLLITQTQSLIHDIPQYIDRLQGANTLIGQSIRRYNTVAWFKDHQQIFMNSIFQSREPLVGVARSVLGGIAATVTVLALTFFILLEGTEIMKSFWSLHKPAAREHRQKLAQEMYQAVTGYVTGNLLTSVIAAIATGIVLFVLGIPFAIPLGILVGVLDLLPLIGATLASVVVVLITAFTSLSSAIIVLIFFFVYQQVENHALQPFVYSRTVKLSPLTVLVAGLLGVYLAGFAGALAAIPIAASLQILLKDYFTNHRKNQF